MYKTIITFLFTIKLIFSQCGWFMQNPLPTCELLNDMTVFDANTIIAFGNNGIVIKTTDGGLSWSNPLRSFVQSGLNSARFFSSYFINNNTGWIVGQYNVEPNPKIYKTTDGGSRWSELINSLNPYSPINSVYFKNEFTGFIGTSIMLMTTNGGNSWNSVIPTGQGSFMSVMFLDNSVGFTSNYRNVYKTTDGGYNWMSIYTLSSGNINKIFFLNSTTGWMITSNNLVKKTSNGGYNWVSYTGNPNMSNIYFTDSLHGWISGGTSFPGPGYVFFSIDGGISWNFFNNISNKYLNSAKFADSNTGYAVGYGGMILKSVNGGLNWSVLSYRFTDNSLTAVWFVDNNTGWVSDGSSNLIKTTNSGTNWFQQSIGTNYGFSKLYFADANTGYGLSSNGLFKTSNSGNNWFSRGSFPYGLAAMNFINVNTGFCYGFYTSGYYIYNYLYKSTNGFNSWDTTNLPNNAGYSCLLFRNQLTGWIAGGGATQGSYVAKTIDGGLSWTQENAGTTNYLTSIFFVDDYTGWVVGNNNAICKTTNGGVNWYSQNFGLNEGWYTKDIFFSDVNTGLAIVDYPTGQILRTTNGGENWTLELNTGVGSLSAFHFINSNTGWAVGGDGAILKTTNGGQLLSTVKPNFEGLPLTYHLFQNYPNPFNPSTKIKFDLPKASFTKLVIYDILGREIATLVNEKLNPGTYEVEWDGTNYPSEVYFYKLFTNSFNQTKRMVLIK
jgi:photosystem II stability/assembly factor-like uncharacterized protein